MYFSFPKFLDITSIAPQGYTCRSILTGHKGPTLSMSVSNSGVLASGASDGTRLFILESGKELERPSGAGSRGATTTVLWVVREDEPDDGLIFGTLGGYIVCWKECGRSKGIRFEETGCLKMPRTSEVTAMAFQTGTNRLVVANRESAIQVFSVTANMELQHGWSIIVNDHVPKALAFSQNGEDILSFGLYDGVIHILWGSDGKLVNSRDIGGMIGSADINMKRGVACLNNPFEGVVLYKTENWNRICVYPVEAKISARPRHVALADDCYTLVSASDHGVVYVFNRRTGGRIFLHLDSQRIHAIATANDGEMSYICAGVCFADDESKIVVWRRNNLPFWQQKRFVIIIVALCVAALVIVFIIYTLADIKSAANLIMGIGHY